MSRVEPIPDAPAAVADLGEERALVIADYHAGIEATLRYEGVEIESRAEERRERLLDLLDKRRSDRLIFLGDLAHWIGEPGGVEREELLDLLDAVTSRVPATLVKGNHDGEIEDAIDIEVSDSGGIRFDEVGFAHGHTWPAQEVLEAEVVCVGHEHPTVRLEDSVGGRRIEPAWLRGPLASEAFAEHTDPERIDGELVVFPAFNDLSGGTWINVEGQSFLSPFLPAGLERGEAYLLDGTRLGDYRAIS